MTSKSNPVSGECSWHPGMPDGECSDITRRKAGWTGPTFEIPPKTTRKRPRKSQPQSRRSLGKTVRKWLKQTVRAWLDDYVNESGEEILLADGFDDALVGYATRCGQPPIAVYDRVQCLAILIGRDGMTHADAEEFFEVNVAGAWVGRGTPCFLVQPLFAARRSEAMRRRATSVLLTRP